MAKLISYTKPTVRKIKTKTGSTKVVRVKAHYNKINRNYKKP
jgi:hypothetical protein